MNPEEVAKGLLAEASASVLTYFFVENGKDRHIVYIHDILFKNDGGIDIKYSTPSENVDKEWLFGEIQKTIKLVYQEVVEKEEKKSFFKKVINYFKR